MSGEPGIAQSKPVGRFPPVVNVRQFTQHRLQRGVYRQCFAIELEHGQPGSLPPLKCNRLSRADPISKPICVCSTVPPEKHSHLRNRQQPPGGKECAVHSDDLVVVPACRISTISAAGCQTDRGQHARACMRGTQSLLMCGSHVHFLPGRGQLDMRNLETCDAQPGGVPGQRIHARAVNAPPVVCITSCVTRAPFQSRQTATYWLPHQLSCPCRHHPDQSEPRSCHCP